MISYDFRRAASVSDNPAKWRAKDRNWIRDNHKVKKTKTFKDFELHWWPMSAMEANIIATLDDHVVADLFYGFEYEGDESMKGAIEVHPDYRRRGLATAMYSWAEQLSGKEFVPEDNHTDAAEAFWRQTNRPFGRGVKLYDD